MQNWGHQSGVRDASCRVVDGGRFLYGLSRKLKLMTEEASEELKESKHTLRYTWWEPSLYTSGVILLIGISFFVHSFVARGFACFEPIMIGVVTVFCRGSRGDVPGNRSLHAREYCRNTASLWGCITFRVFCLSRRRQCGEPEFATLSWSWNACSLHGTVCPEGYE